MLPDHIRRIACNYIKRSSIKKFICFSQVPRHNIDLVLQSVEAHTAPRHIRALLLYLNSADLRRLRLRFHQDRNDTSTCTHVQHACPGPHLHKTAEQHSIHAKTELFRILYDLIAIALQIVNALIFLYLHAHPHPSMSIQPPCLSPCSAHQGLTHYLQA